MGLFGFLFGSNPFPRQSDGENYDDGYLDGVEGSDWDDKKLDGNQAYREGFLDALEDEEDREEHGDRDDSY